MTSPPRPRAILVAFGALAALGLLAFLPGVALADNCSNLGDCWSTAGGAAGTAVGIGVAAGLFGGLFGPPIPPGFKFMSNKSGKVTVRSEPSSDAPVVGVQLSGSRTVYRNVVNSGGTDWYYITPAGVTPGWVSGEDTSDRRPTAPPLTFPMHLRDSQLGAAKSDTSADSGAAKG
jgi:hypothetical protein